MLARAARPGRDYAIADHLRHGPARPRPPLRDRRRRRSARELGWTPAETFATGLRADGALVSRQRRVARRGDERRVPAVDRAQLRRRARRATERDDAQGHHPRRRLRHAAVPGHAGRVQAAAAGLRQADDLLPAVDADAGRHPRHPADLDARGHAALRAAARRRRAAGASTSRYAVQPSPGRPRAGVHHRPRLRRPRRVARWCSATTSSTATTCPPQLARATARTDGRDGVRLPGRRPRALRRRRVRRRPAAC